MRMTYLTSSDHNDKEMFVWKERADYNEVSRQCRENKEAVIITVNGRGDTVLLAYEEYNRLKARIELLEILAEADEDVKYGRTAPVQETFDDLRNLLSEG